MSRILATILVSLTTTAAAVAVSQTVPSQDTANSTKTAKKILVYTPHGPGMLKLAKATFQKKHPDVEVDWLYKGAGKIFDQLKSEQKNPVADIVWGGPHYLFIDGAQNKLFQAYRPSWHNKVNAKFHDAKQSSENTGSPFGKNRPTCSWCRGL